jgi:hypothetical protein
MYLSRLLHLRIQIFMLNISFIDAIYFSIVSMRPKHWYILSRAHYLDLGDIHPTPGNRIFNIIYKVSGGMLNLALGVVLIHEMLLEG